MKILLLNTPSGEQHLRGNYCSNVSKGVYYYPAIELLAQSGILSQGSEIEVCDAIAEGLAPEAVLSHIDHEQFDGVLALTGSSSRREDMKFFQALKRKVPQSRLLISGGYLLTQHREALEDAPYVDGVLLDFTSSESVRFFRGKAGPFQAIALPGELKDVVQVMQARIASYPTPRHELFPLRAYHHPNARYHPYSLLIHSSGCPFTCDYCIYSITPYKARPVEEVVEELRYMRSRGLREAFFHDPTFAVKRGEGLELCRAISKADIDMAWFCQTRVDQMDEELLLAMRDAGCHAIMFGVESADEGILRDHKRRIAHEETRSIYALCRKLGIRTLSYLVLGLPGDTAQTIASTVDFVKEIHSDFVSFNLAIPVIGTEFRNRAIQEGLTDDSILEFDNSSDAPPMPTRHLSQAELQTIHRQAVKSFFFRPSYIWQRLISIRSLYELRNHFREGFALFRHWLSPSH